MTVPDPLSHCVITTYIDNLNKTKIISNGYNVKQLSYQWVLLIKSIPYILCITFISKEQRPSTYSARFISENILNQSIWL